MEFRTLVELPRKELEIAQSDKLMLLGSCFAENIGGFLKEYKFNCDVNPYGILYNPMSVLKALREIKKGRIYLVDGLFRYGDFYHSFMHHSNFSDKSEDVILDKINERLVAATQRLKEADLLMITLGSAFVYIMKDSGEVVANCHKLPESYFERRLLSVEEIVREYVSYLSSLFKMNPKLKILLTVSPIRHLKDGLHGCQLSKSVLLLSVNQLQEAFPKNVFYFPSYELMMDELRDYRFYGEDMLHPSKTAIKYLWEGFAKCYFSSDTQKFMKEWDEILKGLYHKPFRADSPQYKKFLTQLELKIQRIKEKCPNLDVKRELELCHTLLMH